VRLSTKATAEGFVLRVPSATANQAGTSLQG
jgi:hypothetical protein